MSKQAYVKETPHLTSSPSTPATGWTKTYYHQPLDCFVYYDESRAKWLSDLILPIDVFRAGNLAAGSSFRMGEGLPTSTTPILLERNVCLVGIVASTSALEQFVMRVDDVGGGSGNTLAINYQAVGPTTTRNFTKLDLNQNYNAGDTLDIYILSSASGNVSNPRVRLLFRYRA